MLSGRNQQCGHTLCDNGRREHIPNPYSQPPSLKPMAMILLAGTVEERRFVPYSMLRIRASALQLCWTCSIWADIDAGSFAQALEKFFCSIGRDVYWDCRHDSIFGGDRTARDVWVKKQLQEPHPTAVPPNSRKSFGWIVDPEYPWDRHEDCCLHRLDGTGRLANDPSKGLQALVYKAKKACVWEGRSLGAPTMSRTNALSENDGSLIVSPLALFTCLQWLEDEAHLERLEFKDKGNVRNALAHLLGEVCTQCCG